MALISQIKLTFTRNSVRTVDDWGFPVESSPTTLNTRGSLEPLSYGERLRILPEGYATNEAKLYYTKTKLIQRDECTINGKTFMVMDIDDWTTNNSRLSHYEVVLMAKEPTQ